MFTESDEKKTEDSETDVNQTAELCDADTVESSLPPDSRQKRLADLQAERAACDPTRLQILKVIFKHFFIFISTPYPFYLSFTRFTDR